MFKEYVIVVTGAASGIGLATSRLFLAAGATVIGVDVAKKSLNELAGAYVDINGGTLCDADWGFLF